MKPKKGEPFYLCLLLFTDAGCSWLLRLSSSSTLLQQLWQIHRGTSPSRDWDSEGTASASFRPGASRNKAWESAGTASANLVPWPPGSPFTEPAPQSLNSRWHRRQQVCMGWKEEEQRGNKWVYRVIQKKTTTQKSGPKDIWIQTKSDCVLLFVFMH